MATNQSLEILLVDDEEIVHKTIGDYLRDLGHAVVEAHDASEALREFETHDFDLALVDILLPGKDGISLLAELRQIRPETPVIIVTAHGSMDAAIQALRLGAADFVPKPVKLLELDAVLERTAKTRALLLTQRHLKNTIGGIQAAQNLRELNRHLVGVSSSMDEVRRQIRLAVASNCDTILVTGETGTGKEVVARELHYSLEEGNQRPFIAVSCPALTDSLVESELFGHMKGAFTGATQDKAGYFELADGGTLFLDEVGDLSTAAQAKLLRILETRTLRRVGGSKEITVDLRLVASTNVSLEDRMKAGRFRRDLFFRLNVFAIHLLPLRERREDIMPLAEYFLAVAAARRGFHIRGFSEEARDLLFGYDYPGNARELRSLVERATILCGSDQIHAKHLVLSKEGRGISPASTSIPGNDERASILGALEDAQWNRRQAADALGIPYSTLRYRMMKLGIS
jgi:DNA-binding NtrC family response regulator